MRFAEPAGSNEILAGAPEDPSMLIWLALVCTKTPDDTAAAYVPAVVCPGSAGCESNGGPLYAGAAAVSITPPCFEEFVDLNGDSEWDRDEEVLDCGCDRLCPGDEGYTGPDEGEGDGEAQVVWIAGFQNNRPASGVRDELWARAVVFDQGDVRVAIVVLDLVGWFRDDVLLMREQTDALDVDHLVVLSTHTHEGPDTMGLWGRTETSRGVDEDYREWVRDQAVESVAQAVADLREVGTFTLGKVDASAYHPTRGIENVLQDKRDPYVVDLDLGAAWIQDVNGDTIATLAHFGNHPEAMADENNLLTSDYAHALRDGLENGVDWGPEGTARPGLGGTALFLTGSVGGMMTPLGITTLGGDGVDRREYTFEKTDSIGWLKAEMALDAIEQGQVVDAPELTVAAHEFVFPVDNWGFQAMFITGILDRETVDWDPTQPIDDDNVPYVRTEVDLIRVGPLELLTIPGELLPELAVGGYDGSQRGTTQSEVVDPENPNPPDLSLAPQGPYLKERVGGEHVWLIGLANDELGYIVPEYDFKVDEIQPWFEEPEGDHYEETNSMGPQTAGILDAECDTLLEWVDANQR
jgi:hypothetical protein